jgi:hypothetical protein
MGESMINPPATYWFRADHKEPTGMRNRVWLVLGPFVGGPGGFANLVFRELNE